MTKLDLYCPNTISELNGFPILTSGYRTARVWIEVDLKLTTSLPHSAFNSTHNARANARRALAGQTATASDNHVKVVWRLTMCSYKQVCSCKQVMPRSPHLTTLEQITSLAELSSINSTVISDRPAGPILNLDKLSQQNTVYLRYLWNVLSLRAHRALILSADLNIN